MENKMGCAKGGHAALRCQLNPTLTHLHAGFVFADEVGPSCVFTRMRTILNLNARRYWTIGTLSFMLWILHHDMDRGQCERVVHAIVRQPAEFRETLC
jgi:hypothetical protein